MLLENERVLEGSLSTKFEQRCLEKVRFHSEIIQSSQNFDHNDPLLFLELDALRSSHVELIPERIKNRGYDPDIDPQTIVLGQRQDLEGWRERHDLNAEEFVIEPSGFGYHIDVYGSDVSRLIEGEKNIMTEWEYCMASKKNLKIRCNLN